MIPTLEEYKQLDNYQRKKIRRQQKALGLEPYHANKESGSPKPYIWISGPDLVRHQQYVAWGAHKCQAEFRGELYELTYDDFVDIWADCWHLRGRKAHNLIMTRDDLEGAWTVRNTILMERLQHIRRVAELLKLKRS